MTSPFARETALAAESQLDLVGIDLVDETLQLAEPLARDDHTARQRRRISVDPAIDARESMAVGRDHPDIALVA